MNDNQELRQSLKQVPITKSWNSSAAPSLGLGENYLIDEDIDRIVRIFEGYCDRKAKELDEILIDLYESAMLHGEAQAGGVLPTQKQREDTVIIAKAAIQAYIARQCREIKISRAAKIAMAVAKSQLKRGENPTKNITATLLLELENIAALQQKGEK